MNLQKLFSLAPVVAAIGLAGAGFSQNAEAYVYAGSKLDITNLTVTVAPTGANTPSVTGFGFSTSTSANLNASSDGDADNCGGTILSNTCSALAPTLSSDAANAPGSGITRLNTDYSLSGNNLATYANSNSKIGDASLSTGNPTTTSQVSEANLTGNGGASASTSVQSNTNFTVSVLVLGGGTGTVTLDFNALYAGMAVINNAPASTLDANSQFSVNTQASWQLAGGTDPVPFQIFFPTLLNVTTSTGPLDDSVANNVNQGFNHVFSYTCTAAAGADCRYTLNLQSSTGVVIRNSIPEPGTLALLGAGLLGLGLRRRAKA